MSTVGNLALTSRSPSSPTKRQGDDDETVEQGAPWKFHHFCPCLGRRLDVVQHHLAAVQGQTRDDAADALEGRLLVEERHHDSDEPIGFFLVRERFSGRL
jgi:hypothetical protein